MASRPFQVQRQTYGVKVNNLPTDISEDKVREIFQVYGSIGVVRVQIGNNVKYAYVNFNSKNSAEYAVSHMDQQLVGGRKIRVLLQPHAQGSIRSSNEAVHTVKVTYLSKQTTESTLHQIFSIGGRSSVVSIKIILSDAQSGFNYAYVNYSSRKDAEEAERNLNKARIDGTTIKVKLVDNATSDTPTHSPITKQPPYPLTTGVHRAEYSCPPHVGGGSRGYTGYSGCKRASLPNMPAPKPLPARSSRVPPTSPPVLIPPYSESSSGLNPFYRRTLSTSPGNASQPTPHHLHRPYRSNSLSPSYTSQSNFGTKSPLANQSFVFERNQSVTSSPSSPARNLKSETPTLSHSPPAVFANQSPTIKVSIFGDLTAEDIEQVFNRFGKLQEMPIVRPGKPNFCYVNYSTPEEASKACALNCTTISGVRVEVKQVRKQRNTSSLNQDSRSVSCTSLIVSILQANRRQELEQLKGNHEVSLKPTSDSFKMWGKSEQLDAAQSLLQQLISETQKDVKSEHCELPCHSLPFFAQDKAVEQFHKIEETHGVEFSIQPTSAHEDPVNIDCFKEELCEHFPSTTTAGQVSETIPKRQTLTSYLKPKPRPSVNTPAKYQWLWENDDSSGYVQYNTADCENINKHFNASTKRSFTISSRNSQTYKMDFRQMTQTNVTTGRVRTIKRVPKNVQWHWQDDKKEWFPYSAEKSFDLETMFQAHHPHPMVIKGKLYTFDFDAMAQRNVETKHMRKIERRVHMESEDTNISDHVLTMCVCGLQDSLSPAIFNLQETISDAMIEKECSLHSSSQEDFKSRLLQNMNQYLVTPSLLQHSLKLQGMPQYVERVALLAEREKNAEYERQLHASKGGGGQDFDMPAHWSRQTDKYLLSPVPQKSEEWKKVEREFHKTLSTARITKLERIQNKWLWERYCFARKRMVEANRGKINEENLFHGTRSTPPSKVIKSDKGIDFRYSKKGLWGEGSYFAVNASYSDTYAYEIDGSEEKRMLVCQVLTGESYNYESNKDSSLRQPPVKPSSRLGTESFEEERYDSVKGYTNGSYVFVVYDHEKVYPAYLVTYKNNYSRYFL